MHTRSSETDNQLLAALPPADRQVLQADLEWVELEAGAALYEADSVLRLVYFPVTATVSLVSSLKDGTTAEVALVGAEGVVGVCAFMGGGPALSGAVVQGSGQGWRLSAAGIVRHAGRSEPLMRALLRYTQVLLVQLAQTSACNRHHRVEQQLCRWLLSSLDRHPGSALTVTHEVIAGMLGVRREAVTESAGRLRRAGLIRCGRGQIAVLDRRGLEALSCECYTVVRQACDRLHTDVRQPAHA